MQKKQNPPVNILNVGWSIGTYCNANCNQCYSINRRNNKSILSKHEIDIILEKLIDSNIKTINLGGNEPIYTNGSDISLTLLPYVIRKVVSAGISIGITTNGITARYLERHHPDVLFLVNDWDISLDSPFEAEHNQNRGSNLFGIALDTLAHFCKNGIRCSIVLCAMNWNTTKGHARRLVDLAYKYNTEIRINSIRPIIPSQFSLQPTRRQFYNFFCELDRLTTSIYIGEPILACLVDSVQSGCYCGKSSIRIHPKSEKGQVPVSPCVFLSDYDAVDLLNDDISHLTSSPSFQEFRTRSEKLPQMCIDLDCEWLEKCRGGCMARAWLNSRDLDSPDPLCPKLAQKEGINLPTFLSQEIRCNGIRVHEGYLCTWIGKPTKSKLPSIT